MKVLIPEKLNAKINGFVYRGIKAVEINDEGHIVFTLTDNTRIDLGDISGGGGGSIESIILKESNSTGNVYTISLSNGKTFDIVAPKGEKGNTGAKGDKGDAGKNGENGFSPVIEITPVSGAFRITVTDVNGTRYFDLPKGENGTDGYSPVKGIDYWTVADQESIIAAAKAKLLIKDITVTTKTTSGTLIGDLEGNGIPATIADLTTLAKYIDGIVTLTDKDAADLNADGIVDGKDLELLQNLSDRIGSDQVIERTTITYEDGTIANFFNFVDVVKTPTKVSELENDNGFITKAVQDLENYYRKTETYSQEEIDHKISTIPKFAISVVSELPTQDISTTTIYLLKAGANSPNLYTEYIFVKDPTAPIDEEIYIPEKLGEQTVNLTGYATETWTIGQLANYIKSSELANAINNALVQAKVSGEFDGNDGKDGFGIYTTTENPPDDNNGYSFTIATIDVLDGRQVQVGDLLLKTDRWEIFKITEIDGTYAYSEYLGCIRGTNGTNGTNGQDGEDGYTPVKGIDYWTKDDKAEMVNDVLAAFPTETWTFTIENGSTVTKNVVMKS